MDEIKDWMWLVKTNQGDFFLTVVGKWTQEEAAEKVRLVFKEIKIDIAGMIPRKRATGSDDIKGTIWQQEKPRGPRGFYFLAGRKIWQICGRVAEYEAKIILFGKGDGAK